MQKKAEKINEDLLSENSESKGIWDSIARFVLYFYSYISMKFGWFYLVQNPPQTE